MVTFDLLSAVIGGAVALVGFLLVMAVIVPDEPARRAAAWLVTRRNVPTMIMPLAVPALVIGLIGFGYVLWLALSRVYVPGWIWLLLAGGGLGVALFALTRVQRPAPPAEPRRRNRQEPHRQVTAPAGPPQSPQGG